MGLVGFILATVYVAVPAAVAAAAAVRCTRAKSIRPAASFLITCASGLVIGTCMATLFAVVVSGHVRVGQVLLTAYFAVAALCILKGLSWVLERAFLRLFGVEKRPETLPLPRLYRTRFTTAFILRGLVLYAIGLPYVMAVAMVLNMLVASAVGVLCPLILERIGRDPVQGSSILLTAITDSMGFLIFLGLASAVLL